MIYGIVWYVQDFLWVLGAGKILIPEIFLILLVVLSMWKQEKGEERYWAAFIGGVLWDLRWLGFPGPTALIYVLTIMAVRWIWLMVPVSGRTVLLFGAILWCALLPVSLLRILLWGLRGGTVFMTYLLQQSYNLPIVLFACALYAWKLKNSNA
jgi:rod shape-determining protein MreD